MTIILLTLAALTTIPLDYPTTDHIETVEHNHFYDCHGKEIFQQAIVWEFNPHACRYDVRCWWLIKRDSDVPSKDMLRFDGETMRRIRAGKVVRSWTQYDPETTHRQIVPNEERRKLSPPLKDVRRVLEE